jgi:hypothetical protein
MVIFLMASERSFEVTIIFFFHHNGIIDHRIVNFLKVYGFFV